MMFQPDPSPLGAPWISALVALLPILTMLVTLGVLRWKAHLAGFVSWLVAAVVAVTAFSMPVSMALATSLHGFVYGLFPIVWILLCAIWMYQVTVISGRFDDLRATFYLITDDPRVLGLLIAFCFGGLLEALAGFGAPVAIVSVMLIAVGFSPLRAAITALIANTVPVAFGAVGLPVLMAAETSGLPVADVSPVVGRICAILAVFVPTLLLAVMDGRRGVAQCWPAGLFVGVVFAAVKWIVSDTPLYNLTEVFAAVVTVVGAVVLLRVWRPKGGADAAAHLARPLDPELEGEARPVPTRDETPPTGSRVVMALVPYLLVIAVFAVTAIPVVRDALTSTNVTFPWPGLDGLLTADGAPAGHRTYTLSWLSTPGTLLALVALMVGLIYRVPLREVLAEGWRNAVKLRFTALTIGAVVALAFVMGDSGQTMALGLFIAGSGAAYPYLSPIPGWIGTYVTGSDTSANILFSGLQSSIGDHIGHTELLVGAGASGGVVGKMISPQSLAVAASAIGIAGAESAILRRVFGYSILLLAFMCVLTGLMSTPVLGWLLP